MTEEKCPHCGAAMKKYWHRITPGLVKALVKAYAVVCEKGDYHFTKKDLDLNHSEYGNFQKLRFHGFIAKHKVDGEWKRGEWILTRRAGDFLTGKIDIPARVQTFRNKVVDHDIIRVTVGEVMKSEPYFEVDFDYSIFDPVQERLL